MTDPYRQRRISRTLAVTSSSISATFL